VVHLEQPRRICCSCFCVPREGKCIVVEEEEEEVSRLLRNKRTEEEKEITNQLEKQITKKQNRSFWSFL
jgi:hypothetical protein